VAVIDFDVHHGNGTEEGFVPDDTLFYGSTHEKDNFPGTGKDPSPYVGDQAKTPLHRRIVNRTLPAGPASVKQFHVKWAQVVDEMALFAPDLVIISAGFDAHDEDPLASVELQEEDFKVRRALPHKHPRSSLCYSPPDSFSLCLTHHHGAASGRRKSCSRRA